MDTVYPSLWNDLHSEGDPLEGRCCARTRSGRPCQRWPVRQTGRCPNHGGMSTGPRTKRGKAAVSAYQKKRWAKYRAERAKERRKRA